jgi:hypothetical protein
MTLPEWTLALMTELKAAGFEVGEFHGFPLVTKPREFSETCRLLEFMTSLPADREIWDKGMLFLPRGSRAASF